MGLPSIHITFQNKAGTAIARGEKGTVAILIKDASDLEQSEGYVLKRTSDIPEGLTEANRAYVERAFLGYVNPPRKVLLYVVDASDDDLSAGLAWAATQKFDYIVGPESCTAQEATAIKTWVLSQRKDYRAIYKAVLPNTEADDPAIVNFASSGMTDGTTTWTAAQYCSRIAGLLAGTPMDISCTYAPLPELTDVTRMTEREADAAIDGGKLILIHDGIRVKVARGVTSFVTTTAQMGAAWKKIKLVEIMDLIQSDIRSTAQDSFIGKYACSYDNKCVLVAAIDSYLRGLERSGLLQQDSASVRIDTEAQEAWLTAQGIDTEGMSEQELKEANTGDKVFLAASVQLLDAIEDISLEIAI